MDIRNQIITTLRATGRENIEKVITYMSERGFFSVHCHRHHHYRGGLADHAWQTYLLAKKMKDEEIKKGNASATSIDDGSLAISALLHDFCDCHGMHHIRNHGSRSARMLKELGCHLSSDEFLAIRFHMSLRRHLNHPLYQKANDCLLRRIVHQADGGSARLGKGCDIE